MADPLMLGNCSNFAQIMAKNDQTIKLARNLPSQKWANYDVSWDPFFYNFFIGTSPWYFHSAALIHGFRHLSLYLVTIHIRRLHQMHNVTLYISYVRKTGRRYTCTYIFMQFHAWLILWGGSIWLKIIV